MRPNLKLTAFATLTAFAFVAGCSAGPEARMPGPGGPEIPPGQPQGPKGQGDDTPKGENTRVTAAMPAAAEPATGAS